MTVISHYAIQIEGASEIATYYELPKARRRALSVSKREGLAYVVAYDDDEAVGHVVYADGYQSSQEGILVSDEAEVTAPATHTEAKAAATLALATYLAQGHEAELVETATYFTLTVDGVELDRSYPFTITDAELAALEAQRDDMHVKIVELRTREDALWTGARELDDSDPRQAAMGKEWMQVRIDVARAELCYAEANRTLDNQQFAAALR